MRVFFALLLTIGSVTVAAQGHAPQPETLPWRLDTDLRLRADALGERSTSSGSLTEASVRADIGDTTSRAVVNVLLRRFRIDGEYDDDALLREALYSQRLGATRWVLGKQLLLWGRADGFRVLDVLVPTDVPDAFYEEPENSRRGVWAARMQRQLPGLLDSELQLWFSPDRALQRNVPAAADLPALRSRADSCGGTCGSSALRWSSQFGRVDWSLHALHGLWRETATQPAADGTRVAPTVTAYGASFDAPIEHVVWRAEALHVARTRSLMAHSVPRDRLLLGVDVDVGGVMISPQFFAERGAVSAHYASLLVEARLKQDRLRLRLFGVQSLRESEHRWLSGRLRWFATDVWECALSVDRFSGAANGALGSLKDRSRVSIDLVWHGRWPTPTSESRQPHR